MVTVRSGDMELDRRQAAIGHIREKAEVLRLDARCLVEHFGSSRAWPRLVAEAYCVAAQALEREAARLAELKLDRKGRPRE